MLDNEIIDFIFKKSKVELTENEINFWKKIDKIRRNKNCPWKTGSPFDYMSIGIYMGIKLMEGKNENN